jgi:hypothetical protein
MTSHKMNHLMIATEQPTEEMEEPETQAGAEGERRGLAVGARICQVLQFKTPVSPNGQLDGSAHDLRIVLEVAVPATDKALGVRLQIKPSTQIADLEVRCVE